MAHDYADFEEDEVSEEERRKEILEAFGYTLQSKVGQQISQRIEIETRWLKDIRQYNGKYDPEVESRLSGDSTKSSVFVNITRPKSNTAEARLMDMLFPADDKNWGIGPTPVPELLEAAKDKTPVGEPDEEGNQPTVADEAQALMEEARRRAGLMETEISDQLEEANYSVVVREMMHDAVMLGTGVLKAPVVVGKSRQSWSPMTGEDGETMQNEAGDTPWVVDMVDDGRPSVERVDPWDFFPDMSATRVQDCEFFLERHYMTKRDVRKLAQRPGFSADAVREVLKMDPRSYRDSSSDHINKLREIAGLTTVMDDNRYEMWEYHGPVDTESLMACGCDVDEDDPMEAYEGVVWFCGPVILKAVINPMDTEERPYSIFNWEADDTSIFGFGVPHQMRNPQRVINASWRMQLENGGLSVGPQIVVNRQLIEPADGDWKLKGRKVWFMNDSTRSVNETFGAFEINSHQGELAGIFATARELADEETSMPQIAQGEAGHANQTLGGMSILMNSANVVLRRVVKNFDDNITRPVIRRFYDWNMQFNSKTGIKGDYEVAARGTSALLIKEVQQQALMQLMNLTGNPLFADLIKPDKLLRKTVESLQLSPNEIVKSEEQLEQEAQAAAENPQITPEQLEQMKIQADLQGNQERIAQKDREAQMRLAEKELDYQIALARLAQERDISIEKIDAQLRAATMSNRVKRQNFEDEVTLKATLGEGI